MTGRADAGGQDSGVRLTRKILEALPGLDREDEAINATIGEGMLAAAELLEVDDVGTTGA